MKLVILSDKSYNYIRPIADGLEHVVLPTCAMKIINNLIIIKQDVK